MDIRDHELNAIAYVNDDVSGWRFMGGGNHKSIPFTNFRIPPVVEGNGEFRKLGVRECKDMLVRRDKVEGLHYFLDDARGVAKFVLENFPKQFAEYIEELS